MLRSIAVDIFYRAAAMRSTMLRSTSEKYLELTTLSTFLREEGIETILDVGANVGQFATKIRRLGFAGKIISFEPDPRSFEKLTKRHGADPKWEGIPNALGESNGTIEFQLAHESVLSSILSSVRPENVASVVPVAISRLDTVLPRLRGEAGFG